MNQNTTIGIRLKGPTKLGSYNNNNNNNNKIYNIYTIYITMRHCDDIIRLKARISLTQIGS